MPCSQDLRPHEQGIFLAESKGFCPALPAPIASLRSLPRRRKQSTGLFSSASFGCSLLVRIPCFLSLLTVFLETKKQPFSDCFFWRRARDSKSGKRVKKRVKKCKKALLYCILSFEIFFLKAQEKNNKNKILNTKKGVRQQLFRPLSQP